MNDDKKRVTANKGKKVEIKMLDYYGNLKSKRIWKTNKRKMYEVGGHLQERSVSMLKVDGRLYGRMRIASVTVVGFQEQMKDRNFDNSISAKATLRQSFTLFYLHFNIS